MSIHYNCILNMLSAKIKHLLYVEDTGEKILCFQDVANDCEIPAGVFYKTIFFRALFAYWLHACVQLVYFELW